jgi:hypothetical protein
MACALALLAQAGGAAPAPDGQTFSTYAVGAADPAVLLEAVRAAAGPEAHVSYDASQQRLLVLAPAAAQENIAELVRQAAPVPVNVRIEVQFRGQGQRRESEASLSGQVGLVREPGLSHTRIRLEPRVQMNEVTQSSAVKQILMVTSGREALLRVGTEVPYLEWIMEYGRHQQVLVEQVAWQQVGAFLAVQPWVLDGGLIRLRITPELRGQVEGVSRAVRFAAAASEVVISDGQSYPLAGLAEGHEFMQRFLVGRASGETTETLDITVTPRVMKP